ERCAEQLMRALPNEPNAVIKDAIMKIMKYIQHGALADAQVVVRGFSLAERDGIIAKYMVDECVPMKSCLECPVEL
ncbi:hypothetical protein PFISCL1PPCAC_14148, partial [Pristionchus fissidentatus]